MDVVALVQGRDHASTRYRLLQFADLFVRRGLRLQIEPIARSWSARLRQINQDRRHQVVFIQRKLLPVWQTLLLRRRVGKLIYDFDDAVFLHDSNHPDGLDSITRRLRFRAIVRSADVLLAGNHYLADQAREYTRNEKIEIVPTCVDPNIYPAALHVDRQPTRMVWIGSSSTLASLERASSILEGIGESIPGTELRVICDRFPRFRHLRVEDCPWRAGQEPEELRSSDIGLSWMPDDRWSSGKCGLKVLQYMAAGLPVIANPVGIHREIIDEPFGFLPETKEDWLDSVSKLSRDSALRRQMGHAGREAIRTRFAIDRWGPVIADRLVDAGRAL
ncbi:glycosyltransferase family 4 protein [bacterium]|jgi:glycosyltransferase involved in cell wall biosynthesis|nr:glycosyltransferase family 4 protein [bacterium]